MAQDNKGVTIILVLLLGIFLQVVLISAADQDKPYRAAIDFTKAYFWLNHDCMADRMVNNGISDNDVDLADAYLQRRLESAQARGFGLDRLRSSVSHIETETEYIDDHTAKVHLSAEVRTAINPVFGFIGKLFGLTESRPVTETITVVRDGHQWRVSGTPFAMADAI